MSLPEIYAIQGVEAIPSPSLLFFADLIDANLTQVIRMAGGPERLRPHVKTHKCAAIVERALARGITRHKCATIAEAEMLAACKVPDVLIAYPLVGPNVARLATLMQRHPATRFSTLVDHPVSARALSRAMRAAGLTLDVLLDLNVGMNRTGITVEDGAEELYASLPGLGGLRPDGLHVYDGQNHQEAHGERRAAVQDLLGPVHALRARLEARGLAVPRVVCGGTPTFPIYASLEFAGLECSPGTFVLHDQGYGGKFGDLSGFTPAALVLTRVISRPGGNRVTLDLGYKAVCADPPAGKRCTVLGVGDYAYVSQSEEHLVLETPQAGRLQPGDAVLAVPHHVCPTVAMYRHAEVIAGGRHAGRWEITARDREISV